MSLPLEPSLAQADCLINGAAGNRLAARDRGLAYGDGLFETMRVVNGRLPLADYHFARLELGALRLKMAPDMPLIRREAEGFAASLGNGVLKFILTRGVSERGYAPPPTPQPTRILLAGPVPSYPPEHARDGVRLFPCVLRLSAQPLLAGIKHLNRLEQVLARAEWQDQRFAEGLLCDGQDRPIECTMSNLFLLAGQTWVTPLLDQCGVQGVMRDYLIDVLSRSGDRLEQRPVTREELLAAKEVFCCNSMFGVWPVVSLEDRCWEVGPRTRAVQAIAAQVFK
jgi:4-amino-4-deoxychorismate lyase